MLKYLCACVRSYGTGNAYAQNFYELIDENIDDVSSNIKDDFNRISNTAMDKKINLSETILKYLS